MRKRLWKVAKVVMEANKPHNLPLENGRTRWYNSVRIQRLKNCGPLVYVPESKDKRIRSSDAQRQEKMGVPTLEEREEIYPFFSFVLC